jgi:alpha-glucosidase
MKQYFFVIIACTFLIACNGSLKQTSAWADIPECIITTPPAEYGWPDFYTKYVNVNGIHLMSSWRVPDSCLVQAYKTLYAMTASLSEEVLDSMVAHNTRVAVMARYEGTTDIPEHAYLRDDTTVNWDVRARGLEGSLDLPLTTCAEENILAYQIDPYHAEDILIHEFAHTIHLVGIHLVDSTIHHQLQSLMEQAIAEGKYQNTYAMENFTEYWAEGVQNWFNVNAEAPMPDGKHNWVNTREDLKEYDPRLYALIKKYFLEIDEHISKHPKVNLYTCDTPLSAEETASSLQIPECVIISPPAKYGWPDFYTKYVNCNGIHIISSWRVPDSCLVQVHKTLYAMTSMLPRDVLDAMTRVDTRVAVMARYEGTTDIPEHAYLASDTTLNWNLRARGLGGSLELPLTSCAEENVLAYQIDKYHAEDILIHEFAHTIHLVGIRQVDPGIDNEIKTLMHNAIAAGRFTNTYAIDTFEEFWAEGVQNWFNVNAEVSYPDGKHNWVNTREDMKAYDPDLYALIARYFPETDEQISKHKKINLYTGE